MKNIGTDLDKRPNYQTIPSVYFFVASIYIVLSGIVLNVITGSSAPIFHAEVYKGLGFVAVTTFLLWYILHREHSTRSAQELRFKQLVESISYGVLVCELPDLGITYCNPAFRDIFGVEATKQDSFSVLSIFPSDQAADLVLNPLRQSEASSPSNALDFQLVKPNYGEFPARLLIRVINAGQNTRFAMFVIADLSKEKEIESKISEHQTILELISRNINDVFWVKDAETGRIDYVSAASKSLLGVSENEFRSAPDYHHRYIHEDDREHVAELYENLESTNADLRYRIAKSDGTVRWIRERLHSISKGGQDHDRIIGFLEDITDTVNQERILAQTQRLESIVSLTDGIAHDFNNFLLIIQSNTELLEELTPNSPEYSALTKQILDATREAVKLSKNLLVFARAQEIKKEAFNIKQAILNVMELYEDESNLQFEFDVASCDRIPPIVTDRKLLEAGIFDLLRDLSESTDGTAVIKFGVIDYLTESESDPNLEPDLNPGGYVRVAISSPHTTMSEANLDRAFEPFYSRRNDRRQGTIGLSMIHGLLKQSGGNVTLDSSANEGTTICLFLPCSES